MPTEVEWEAAASGKDKRVYAFGDTFDPTAANTFETHLRRTTPIGIFPNGNTPQGISDLSGNMWEWTASQYRDYPYKLEDRREDFDDGTAMRILRGGSWHNNAHFCRVAYRYNLLPLYRLNRYGFRVVVRRPPSQVP